MTNDVSDAPMFALIIAPVSAPMAGAYLGTLAIHEGKCPIVCWPGLAANMAATLGALVGEAGGELWVVEQEQVGVPYPYDATQAAAYTAWTDEVNGRNWNPTVPNVDAIKRRLRTKRWVEWDHELKRAFAAKASDAMPF